MIVFRSLSTFLAGSLAFFIAVDAIPSGNEARFRRPKGRNGAVAKQLLAPFAVTGVQNGQILPRLEVQDLHANADQFNIFLLGLQRMQSANQSDYLSYFQIAGMSFLPRLKTWIVLMTREGIHGRPMANWNDVDGNPNSSSPGYCTHVSNLFLSWHRPYLALYEVSRFSELRRLD
jgi:tyrosinase